VTTTFDMDRYEILGPIGAPGMSRVHAARELATGHEVALRIVRPPEHLRAANLLERVLDAARTTSPRIIPILDAGWSEQRMVLVYELIRGLSVAAQIVQCAYDRRALCHHVLDAALGVAEAHAEGLAHGTLRPTRILAALDGPARVTGFGLALYEDRAHLGVVRLAYCPPELLGDSGDAGQGRRADVWSLGAITYAVVSGRPPHDARDTAALRRAIRNDDPAPVSAVTTDVPAVLDEVLACALDRDPDRRYADAGEFAAALDRALSSW